MGKFTPHNIAITFAKNSSTGMNFTWNTQEVVKNATLSVWHDEGKVLSFECRPYVRDGYSYHPHHGLGRPEVIPPTTSDHLYSFAVYKVYAAGLLPNTTYSYKLGGCGEYTQGTFTTGKEDGDFSFVYLADAQAYSDKNFEAFRLTVDAALKRVPTASFFVMPGDMVDIGNSEELWRKFFEAGQAFTSHYPIVPAIGNHETDLYAPTFADHFHFQKNDNPQLPDHVYSFDYGHARVVVLSTELWQTQLESDAAFLDAQQDLLRKAFTTSGDKWRVVVMHKALYTSGPYTGHSGTIMYKQIFEPLFDELGVHVVLQGHDHTFTKAFVRGGKAAPLVTDTSALAKEGTFYLLANSSGEKFYDPVPAAAGLPLLKYEQTRQQLYTVIHVSTTSMRFETYTHDSLYDTFVLLK